MRNLAALDASALDQLSGSGKSAQGCNPGMLRNFAPAIIFGSPFKIRDCRRKFFAGLA